MKPVGREDDAWMSQVRPPLRDLSLGLRQLSLMLQAGVHLMRALEALTQQPDSPELAEIWWTVQGTVGRGGSLSQALAPFSRCFSRQTVHLVQVGERTGSLVAVLARLADHFEREDDLRRRLLSAMAYPLVVLLVSALVSGGLLRFVLPPFLDSLVSLKLQLPWPTRILLLLSGAIRHPWWLAALAMGLWFSRARWLGWLSGPWVYRLAQGVPLLNRCLRNCATLRMARAASLLLAGGGEVLRSWQLALKSSGDPRVEQLFDGLKKQLLAGGEPSAFFSRQRRLVSPLFAAVLEVGENTGKTSYLLDRLSLLLEEELDHQLTLLTAMLQPTLLLLVSISTLFVILGLFLPLYAQLSNL
jgi:type IV pilus assembly protein PilC